MTCVLHMRRRVSSIEDKRFMSAMITTMKIAVCTEGITTRKVREIDRKRTRRLII